MSPAEKSVVAKWVYDDLHYAYPGIEKTDGVCGGSACIVRTRIPVWLLVEALQSGASESHRLTSIEIGRDRKQLMLELPEIIGTARFVENLSQKFADGVVIKNAGR